MTKLEVTRRWVRWGRDLGEKRHRWLQALLWLCLLFVSACSDGEAEPRSSGRSPSLRGIDAAGPFKQRPAALAAMTGQRAVWVQLSQTPNLTSPSRTKGWNRRGQAVYDELKNNAQTSQAALKAYLQQKGLDYKSHFIVNAIRVEADDQVISEIERRPDVARVVDDRVLTIPPPAQASPQVGVDSVEWNIDNIGASAAWDDFGTRGEGIVVASIDTGVEYTHPALVNQYRGRQPDGSFDHNYNWQDPSNVCGFPSEEPCDNAGHGTHTMGTIVGDDGGENQIGVAPGAQWITAKGCEDYDCSLDALLSAGEWILAPTDLSGQNPRPDLRPQIVNNSWGGFGGDEFFRDVVEAWVASGIFPVFAAGNDGPYCGSVGSPGDYDESYAVGAYDIDEELAYFSGRGPSYFGTIKPNIAAPGVDVRSSVPGGQYAWYSGTSMAAPHVAGSVALLWSAALAISGNIGETRTLLDTSAIDHDDLYCGGEPENNNAWGEGRLDVYSALAAAPIGPTGTLVGTVTDADENPLAGVSIAVEGTVNRRTTSDQEGAFSLRLPVGVFQVNVTAFGYLEQSTEVQIEEDSTTEISFVLEAAPSFAIEGTLDDADGAPLAGATVTLLNTPLPSLTTDEEGYFQFAAVPVGEYTLRARAGGCYLDENVNVAVVDQDVALSLEVDFKVDDYGYQCRPVDFDYEEASNPIGLSYDDEQVQVELPFPMTLYGETYSSMWVTTNGYLAFESEFPNLLNVAIPNPETPNAAIYPLWDDLVVLDGVYTETRGSAPERQFVVEWRDVTFYEDYYGEITGFQVILHETGEITMQYVAADGELSSGSSATIGIENAAGDIAFSYAYNQPVVESGTAVTYEVPFTGYAQGVVTDANDGQPVAAAQVTATDAYGETRTARTNATGVYRLQLTEGSYSLEITKTNYVTATGNVQVVEDQTVYTDFSLFTAKGVVSPTQLELVMAQDDVKTRTLTLSNVGSADLSFEIHEAGGALQQIARTATLELNPHASIYATDTKERYTVARATSSFEPSSPGEVIRYFDPTGLGLAWGIGQIQNLWLSDAYSVQNFEFTPDGAPTGLGFPAYWSGYFPADMALDTARNRMCQLAVGGDNGIHCWNPSTGAVEETITGSPWSNVPQFGLAYRSSDDSFFVGGWNEGVIYQVAGPSYGDPGAILGACSPPDGDISGLAYNESMDVLWVATNSPADTIYELSPDCTVLATLSPPQGGSYQGAGLELDAEGNLWAVAQYPNRVYLVDSGVPSFADVPWLAAEPTSGTLAVSSEQQLTVTVDTTGLTPGLYLGSLVIATNSGRQATLKVPVSLIVSGYVHAINCGGGEYEDSEQEVWEADRAYSNGEYGYVGRSRTRTTRHAIEGTIDPGLYQSAREDPYAYRYDDVPNGVYQIDLRFAEFSNLRFEQRMFDVIAEDTILLPAHDIVYEAGRYGADDYQFFQEVTDGQLDIRFVTRTIARNPVVSAIRVVHRPDR